MNLKKLKEAVMYMCLKEGLYHPCGYTVRKLRSCKTLEDITHFCQEVSITEKEFINLVNKTMNIEKLEKSNDPFDRKIYLKIVGDLF